MQTDNQSSTDSNDENTNIVSAETSNDTGMLGWWPALLGQRKIDIVLNEEALQTFSLKPFGFIPDSLLELNRNG